MYSKGPNISDSEVREVMNFDHNFTIEHGKANTGHDLNIIIENTNRRLVLNAPDLFSFYDFLANLK